LNFYCHHVLTFEFVSLNFAFAKGKFPTLLYCYTAHPFLYPIHTHYQPFIFLHMETVILYVCKHGTTEKIAQIIGDSLPIGNATIIDLKKVEEYNIEHFDTVILGTSTHSGKINRKMRSFISKNAWTLLRKQLGLYLYSNDKNNAAQLLDYAYPNELKIHSKSCRVIGGEFNYDGMSFIEKTLARKILNKGKSASEIDNSQLIAFIEEMTK